MNKALIALVVSGGLAMPGLASALDVVGKALQIYGQAHVSVDYATTHDASNASHSKLNMSSNSSRLGFKGEGPLVAGLTGFYKYEDSISVANGGAAHSQIVHRAAIVGLKGGFGSLALGYQDTVFKDTFKKFDVMFNSIGDSRNILDQGDLDQRSRNGIYYYSPNMGGLKVGLGYSTAWKGDTIYSQNNNNGSLTDAVVSYGAKGLFVMAGYERQKHVDGAGNTNQTITGSRLVGGYKTGPMDLRLIYEHVTNSGANKNPALDRNAYGAAFVYKVGGPGSVILQYMQAASSNAGSDGGKQFTIGYAYKLAKNSKAYVMYDKVNNDTNGTYHIGAGHDLAYENANPGQGVSAFSVGYVFKF